MIKQDKCRNCGAQLEEIGPGKYKCPSCGSVFEIDISNEEELLALNDAARKLRDGKFDEADVAYRAIIAKYSHSYEAYFGRALAKHGIIFVDDIVANKKVPTCYITDVGSFVDDNNFKRAVEFAPKDVKEQYEKQGELIENIITEWKEKASKQEYDVFISFKDKDENNQRTPDSYQAESLYNYLKSEGFNVFFSRQVLREFVSERYEPYIFNAINVAPVMIVYGQSGEYMESTWVRNEWSRFIKKIQTGEKDKSGLVVAFENMNGSDLPVEFKSIQCMDASEKTFYPDLVKHIKAVLEKCKKPKNKINSIKTEFGQVGNKQKKMSYQQVTINELGKGIITKVNETDEFIWESAQKFYAHRLNKQALEQLERFLANNEYHYGANEMQLLINSKKSSIANYIKDIKTVAEAEKIKFLVTLCEKDRALSLIDLLLERFYKAMQDDDELMFGIFGLLLDLDFPRNTEMRKKMVEYLTHPPVKFNNRFDDYIKYIDNNDIDFHIQSRLDLIKFDLENKRPDINSPKYIEELKSIDEGNIQNLKYDLFASLDITPTFAGNMPSILNGNVDLFFEKLVNIFKYCESAKDVLAIIDDILGELLAYITYEIKPEDLKKAVEFFNRLVKFIPDEHSEDIYSRLEKFAKRLYACEIYAPCLDVCATMLNYTKDKDDTVFLVLMCKMATPNYSKSDEANFADCLVNEFDEFKVLFGSKYEEQLFKILEAQTAYRERIEYLKTHKKEEKKILKSQKPKKVRSSSSRRKLATYRFLSVLRLIFVLTISIGVGAAIFYGFYKFELKYQTAAIVFCSIFLIVHCFLAFVLSVNWYCDEYSLKKNEGGGFAWICIIIGIAIITAFFVIMGKVSKYMSVIFGGGVIGAIQVMFISHFLNGNVKRPEKPYVPTNYQKQEYKNLKKASKESARGAESESQQYRRVMKQRRERFDKYR